MSVGTSVSAPERHLWQFGVSLFLQKNKQQITQRALAGHFWLTPKCDESPSDALKLVPTVLGSRLAQWMASQAQNVSGQNVSAESRIACKVIYRSDTRIAVTPDLYQGNAAAQQVRKVGCAAVPPNERYNHPTHAQRWEIAPAWAASLSHNDARPFLHSQKQAIQYHGETSMSNPLNSVTNLAQFRIGVSALIFRQGEILLAHRSDIDWWNLPGGGMELGETLEQTVSREVLEETGLQVAIERLVGVYSKPQKQEVVLSFLCRITGGELTTTLESRECRFFPPDALPNNTLPKHRQRIEDVLLNQERALIRNQLSTTSHDQNLPNL